MAKARLTLAEQKLLRLPPTTRTWICAKTRLRHDAEGVEKIKCGTLNSGGQQICWLCGGAKPAKPQLLWPAYVKACAKAGIEPGTRWPPRLPVAPTPAKKTRRKAGS